MPRLGLALDTSAAIFLDLLGYIERLREIAYILLAPVVVRELQAAPGEPGSTAPDHARIEVRPPTVIVTPHVAFCSEELLGNGHPAWPGEWCRP